MAPGLTHHQNAALRFIAQYAGAHDGTPPSYEEICAELGLSSKSAVSRLVDRLEERGVIRRDKNRARSIEVVEAGLELPKDARARLDAYCRKHGKNPVAVLTNALNHHLDDLELKHLRSLE